MTRPQVVSFIIPGDNNDRFLGEAIASALPQIHTAVEVIVVDKGATVASRQVIARNGRRITGVLPANAGQSRGWTEGCRGATAP